MQFFDDVSHMDAGSGQTQAGVDGSGLTVGSGLLVGSWLTEVDGLGLCEGTGLVVGSDEGAAVVLGVADGSGDSTCSASGLAVGDAVAVDELVGDGSRVAVPEVIWMSFTSRLLNSSMGADSVSLAVGDA